MRVKNSIVNILFGLGNQALITSLSFFSRTVFINTLGIEYLGINGLLTNILAMLSLAEAGIGASIMYSLYKPVAEQDKDKINALMNFFRKAYLAIAAVVLLLGLSIMPFLGLFTKDTNVDQLYLIYGLFLLNTVLPYLYVYKNSFLNICQKGYIVTGIYSVSTIISTLLKICVLHFTENYLLYLLIETSTTLLTSIILVKIVNRKYPYLLEKNSARLDEETRGNIVRNVKAIVLQNIGNYLIFGTENIIISSFISVAAVGLYSNYKMLIEISRTFINQINNNVYHSLGNLVAKESKEKVFSIYKVYSLINFWLYSLVSVTMMIIITPFIKLWIGSDFLLNEEILYILVFTFFERGMRNPITTVKTTSGIFAEDRYAPIIQAVFNLIISIILVQNIGLAGVFLGTFISSLLVPFWYTPYLVFSKIFKLSLVSYFKLYFSYLSIGISMYILVNYLSSFVSNDNLISLLIKSALIVFIINLFYVAIFYKTKEFQYLVVIIRGFKSKLSIPLKGKRKKLTDTFL
ncbi:lipopolysaccharide biosynthesis protein [Metabacillus flavus]|uniref:lipopolysaccharide biosynthesis protein n=1 Tax=Metabacillus flavus TaxID=2823519 RepID=UPI0020164BB0|nr:hypothetical protein [Metabacillus flavus]